MLISVLNGIGLEIRSIGAANRPYLLRSAADRSAAWDPQCMQIFLDLDDYEPYEPDEYEGRVQLIYRFPLPYGGLERHKRYEQSPLVRDSMGHEVE